MRTSKQEIISDLDLTQIAFLAAIDKRGILLPIQGLQDKINAIICEHSVFVSTIVVSSKQDLEQTVLAKSLAFSPNAEFLASGSTNGRGVTDHDRKLVLIGR